MTKAFEHFEHLDLCDGTRIVVMPTDERGVLTIQRRRTDSVLCQIELPYPSAGVGGARVVASPSERLALISLYSGQSEEAYELLDIVDGLRRIAGQDYQFGQAASYCFSTDESVVVMALPYASSDWWAPWEDEQVETLAPGRLAFDFGQLRFQQIATGEIFVATIRISVPERWSPDRRSYDADMRPRFLPDGSLAVSLPWREWVIPVPAPATLVVPVDE